MNCSPRIVSLDDAICPGVTWFTNSNLIYGRQQGPLLQQLCPFVFGGGDKLIMGQRTGLCDGEFDDCPESYR
jgi:hypothetical protein